MVRREVSLNCVLAWVGWSMAIVFAVVSLLLPRMYLMGPTILFACAGGVLHIRGFVEGLEHRERAAFELGRDSVTPMRR